jgi:hypothetical protein
MRTIVANRVVAKVRLAVVALISSAVIATVIETASRATINPFNFFGYFTIQSNLFGAVVLALAAFAPQRWRDLIVILRACAATYLILVGIVYALLLAPLGAAGGVPVPWANVVMHIATPLYFAVDWLVAPDRRHLRWRQAWLVLVYPLLWCVVVLIRGATDGWVPYPFLDPDTGYDAVAVFIGIITIAVTVVGIAIWATSHLPRTRAAAAG